MPSPVNAAPEPSTAAPDPQEVMEATWEVPTENLPPVGSPVQFFTNDRRRQWSGVGTGPYAAIVTGYGEHNSLTLYVFPCHGAMPPQLYENVPALSPTDALVWWRSLPHKNTKKK